ncbi:MAG: hypothetical protein KF773_15090 [Deltaproteobacteria bacterium]|nr:hypothetical protein [Deltaproteobacteria bacterium]
MRSTLFGPRRGLVVVAAAAAAACGRIDFDPAGAPPPDTAGARTLCDLAILGDVAGLDGAPLALRVVPTAGDVAIVIGTDAGNIYVVRASSSLAVTSVHLPLQGGYALRGAGAVGDTLFIQADIGTDAYLKRLDPSWDSYATMDQGTPAHVDPPIAPLGTDAVQGIVQSGELRLRRIDAGGTELATLPPRAAVAASLAPTTTGVQVASDPGDGTCLLADAANPGPGTTLSACALPVFVAGSSASLLLHRDPIADTTVLRDLTRGTTTPFPRRVARGAVLDGAPWIASADPTTMLSELVDDTLVESPLPIPTPFDLTPPTGLIWLDGTTLHRGTPCRD